MNAFADAYRQTAENYRQDELVSSHLPFVGHTLARLAVPISSDNRGPLVTIGILNLLQMAHAFDPHQETTFAEFGYRQIREAVLAAWRRECPPSETMRSQITRLKEAYALLPTPATIQQLALTTALTEDQVIDALALARIAEPSSWNNLQAEIRSQQDATSASHEAETLKIRARLWLVDAVERLPELERHVISMYYLDDMRVAEIGSALELPETTARRLLVRAEFRLKENIRNRKGI